MATDLRSRITPRRFAVVTLLDGTQTRLRSLYRSEQRAWREKMNGKDGQPDSLRGRYSDDVFLAHCICDDAGNQIFTADDAIAGCFDQWDMADCQTLLATALRLCHERRDQPAAEDILKNSSGPNVKDEEGALRCFRRAIEVASYPPAYSNLGVLLETRGDTVEAINSFRKVLAKHPDMQGVTANLFKLLYRCERYDAAYELVIKTPVLDSIRFSFRALYITILQRMCDYDRLAAEWPIAREFFQQRFSELDQGYSDDLRNSTADVLNVLLLPMNYGNSFPETEIFRFHADWGRLTAAPDEEICVDNKPPVGGRKPVSQQEVR